jgi:signal transduction histidine kinase
VEISEAELERIKQVAVLGSKMEEMETFIPEIFASLKAMNKSIIEMPVELTAQITSCRERIEKETRSYMHGKFITDVDMGKLEKKLEDKVEDEVAEVNKELMKVGYKVNKAQWVTIGFISAISVLGWLLTKTTFFG